MDQPYTLPQHTHAPAITQIAAAALLTGAFYGLLTLASAAALLIIAPQLRPYWPLALIAAPAIIAAATAGAYGIRWIKTTAALQWEPWEESTPPDDDDNTPNIDAAIQQRAIIAAGYRILVMHYIHDSQATRPECEAAGIQQQHWNSANKILQTMHIKTARQWNDQITPAQAFDLWQSVQYMPNGNAAMVPAGQGAYKRIDL